MSISVFTGTATSEAAATSFSSPSIPGLAESEGIMGTDAQAAYDDGPSGGDIASAPIPSSAGDRVLLFQHRSLY